VSGSGRSLILGGAGFLGSHLAEALLAEGHSVRVFDRANVDLRNLDDLTGDWEFQGGDFLNESDQVRALDGVRTVFHLVSTTIPATSSRNPVYDVETNLAATLRLLDLALEAGAEQVVFLSSGGTVYGKPAELPIPETAPTEPLVSYGVVKLAIEKYLSLYQRLHGLACRVVRLSNPYGPRQETAGAQGAASVFLQRVHAGRPLEIWGDGSVVRDYLYVTDAVAGILAAHHRPGPTGLYNIGSGKGTSLQELVEVIRRVTGREIEVRFLPGRDFDVPANVLDVSRAERELGWTSAVSLEEGLRRTWEWLQERPAP